MKIKFFSGEKIGQKRQLGKSRKKTKGRLREKMVKYRTIMK